MVEVGGDRWVLSRAWAGSGGAGGVVEAWPGCVGAAEVVVGGDDEGAGLCEFVAGEGECGFEGVDAGVELFGRGVVVGGHGASLRRVAWPG